ncbi:kinase-like domain-containing protein [Rhizoctonia solani]|nr:kinase-like domain-containing protein [Rhizoctonia solani]
MANASPPDSSSTRNYSTISGAMPTHEILTILRDHDCEDIIQQLDPENCSRFATSNGGSSDAFKGKLKSGSPIAIKCLRITVGTNDQEGQKQLKRAAHEIYVWSKCKHPNILELTGIAQYQDRIAMVYYGRRVVDMYAEELTAYVQSAEVADGVAHSHSSGIVHGDIKGINIVVFNDYTPKLVDFGTSFLSHYSLQFSEGAQGRVTFTLRYTAPEIILETSKHTMAGDVYGLAMNNGNVYHLPVGTSANIILPQSHEKILSRPSLHGCGVAIAEMTNDPNQVWEEKSAVKFPTLNRAHNNNRTLQNLVGPVFI